MFFSFFSFSWSVFDAVSKHLFAKNICLGCECSTAADEKVCTECVELLRNACNKRKSQQLVTAAAARIKEIELQPSTTASRSDPKANPKTDKVKHVTQHKKEEIAYICSSGEAER